MAKLYIITPDQLESGRRPKTPKEHVKRWKKLCIVLTAILIIETIVLLNLWIR